MNGAGGTITRLRDGRQAPAVAGAFPPPPAFPPYVPPAPPPPPAPVPVAGPPLQPLLRFPAPEQPWATKADVERELRALKEKVALAASLLGESRITDTLRQTRERQNKVIQLLASLAG